MAARDDEADVEPLTPVLKGERFDCEGIGLLEVREVRQRNWSRVAVADHQGSRYFVKQFVDRVGGRHDRGFRGDHEMMASLGEEVVPGVRVVPLAGRVEERLIAVHPHIEMRTIDSISQALPHHGRRASQVGQAIREIFEDRILPEDPNQVSVWKGLDPKNIGWTEAGGLWIFDFGPAAQLDLRTAAARVVAAGLLSRWVARPGTHLIWPERSILRGVCEPIADLTSLELVEAELARHAELRLREPQRSGISASATRLGLRTIGKVHWAMVDREARRLFA